MYVFIFFVLSFGSKYRIYWSREIVIGVPHQKRESGYSLEKMLVVEAYKIQNEISTLEILIHNLGTSKDLLSFYYGIEEGIQALHRLDCKVRGITNKYGTILSRWILIRIVTFLSYSPYPLRRVCKLWSQILHTKEACKILQIPSTKLSTNFVRSFRLDDAIESFTVYNQEIFVLLSKYIQVLDMNGRRLRTIGKGKLEYPRHLQCNDEDASLYVEDKRGEIKVFGINGKLKTKVHFDPRLWCDSFAVSPPHLVTLKKSMVSVYNFNSEKQCHFKVTEPSRSRTSTLFSPSKVMIYKTEIYISCFGSNTLVYSINGRFLRIFARDFDFGVEPSLAIDSDIVFFCERGKIHLCNRLGHLFRSVTQTALTSRSRINFTMFAKQNVLYIYDGIELFIFELN